MTGLRYFYECVPSDEVVRQLTSLRTAVRLSAQSLLIIGVSANKIRPLPRDLAATRHSTSIARINRHLLKSAFVGSVDSDIEQLDRINTLTGQQDIVGGAVADFGVRFIEFLVIPPTAEAAV